MNSEFKSLREGVLAKIKKERVSMYPRAFFLLEIIAVALVAFAALAISVFLCNFILFGLRESGTNEFLHFGNRGLSLFIRAFPWWLLVVDVGLVVLLEWLLRRFRFGYKSPILYLLLGLVVITVSLAFTLERATPFNDFLRDRAHEHRLPPPLNDLYDRSDRPPFGPEEGVCRCTVRAIHGNIITADDVDVGTTTSLIITMPEDDANATTSGIYVGDVILVAGDRDGDTLRAFGIQKLPPGSPSIAPGARQDGPHDTDDHL